MSRKLGEDYGNRLLFMHFSVYDENQSDKLTVHTLRKFSKVNDTIIQKLVNNYGSNLKLATDILPEIESDFPCNIQPLLDRIEIYENVYGAKPMSSYYSKKLTLLEKFMHWFKNKL